jgi:hypothetical protein
MAVHDLAHEIETEAEPTALRAQTAERLEDMFALLQWNAVAFVADFDGGGVDPGTEMVPARPPCSIAFWTRLVSARSIAGASPHTGTGSLAAPNSIW